MTVATTWGTRPTVDDLVLSSYQLAGLLDAQATSSAPEWPQMAAVGRRRLDFLVKHMSAEGFQARQTVFTEVLMQVGVSSYTLSDEFIDIVGDGAYIPEGTPTADADGEIVVSRMLREDWQRLAAKGAEGIPTKHFVDHGTTSYTITVRVWPIPTEAGTIRFQAQRAWRDNYLGNVTVDLPDHWSLALSWNLAHELAVMNSLPLQTCGYLRARAVEYIDYAKRNSNEHGSMQVMVDHPTGWSRR